MSQAAFEYVYFQVPVECPACHEPLVEDGAYLQCGNKQCIGRLEGSIHNWLNKLNVLETGRAFVVAVTHSGLVRKVADLYKLDVTTLAKLTMDGRVIGSSKAMKIVENIDATRRLPIETILGALTIQLIGKENARTVVKAGFDTWEKLFAATAADFATVPKFGPEKAAALFNGLREKEDDIKALLEHVAVKTKVVGGALSGKSICFTGAMVHERKVLQQWAEEAGAEVKSGVSKGLTYLVCADHTTTKSKKAAEYGTAVITEDQFLAMIGKGNEEA